MVRILFYFDRLYHNPKKYVNIDMVSFLFFVILLLSLFNGDSGFKHLHDLSQAEKEELYDSKELNCLNKSNIYDDQCLTFSGCDKHVRSGYLKGNKYAANAKTIIRNCFKKFISKNVSLIFLGDSVSSSMWHYMVIDVLRVFPGHYHTQMHADPEKDFPYRAFSFIFNSTSDLSLSSSTSYTSHFVPPNYHGTCVCS
jgi:hypothetical protein